MNPTLAHLLVRLYPRHWRARYGEEFEDLLRAGAGDLRASANVIASALREHVIPTRGLAMNQYPNSVVALAKQPTAFLPLAMSLAALALVIVTLAIAFAQGRFGSIHQADEGSVAHIWQILMAGQLPVLLFFAIKWLPRAPKQTLGVLALQAVAALAAMAPVFLFHL